MTTKRDFDLKNDVNQKKNLFQKANEVLLCGILSILGMFGLRYIDYVRSDIIVPTVFEALLIKVLVVSACLLIVTISLHWINNLKSKTVV